MENDSVVSCISTRSFKQKNLDILSEPRPTNLGHTIKKWKNWEKTKSVFWLFIKQLVFRIEFDGNIENFLKKTSYRENFFIGFGLAKAGYVSMDLSQFRKFWRKLTFFEVEGLKTLDLDLNIIWIFSCNKYSIVMSR